MTTGAVTSAVTGVFVIPALRYIQGLDLDRETLVQALGLSRVHGVHHRVR
ncbi:hypothetical protein ACU4GD_13770 [Cupriavidus basilensis]